MSGRRIKNRYAYDTMPSRRRSSNRQEASWKQSQYIGANGSGAGAAAAGLSTSMIVGIASLVTVVALSIAFIATSATMFPSLQKDIDKLEDKSELCFCDEFLSDVFALLDPINPQIKAQFRTANLTQNATTYLYTFPDKNGILALLSDIPIVPTSFSDADFFIFNSLDNSKQAYFDASLLTATTNQTYSFPNLSGTLALTSGAQTLSSKTLTGATITSPTNVVHASHLQTLSAPVNVGDAVAPTSGQVLTYNGTIGNWQTPVTSGSFLGTNIVWTGPWSVFPDFVIVNWALTGDALMATTRWIGGLLIPGNNTIYGAEYDLIWTLSSETFGTLNIQDIDPPNAYDVPWAISTTTGGTRLKTSGSIRFLGGKNITGFGSFQGFVLV